jgi:hypothetical protein
MDTFTLIVFGGLAFVLLTLLVLGRFSGRRTRDITNHGDHAAVAARLAIEERDIPEMVDAQNDYRRRTGRAERTEQELRTEVGARELERLDKADAEARSRLPGAPYRG